MAISKLIFLHTPARQGRTRQHRVSHVYQLIPGTTKAPLELNHKGFATWQVGAHSGAQNEVWAQVVFPLLDKPTQLILTDLWPDGDKYLTWQIQAWLEAQGICFRELL